MPGSLTIVGLGPARPEQLTLQARQVLAQAVARGDRAYGLAHARELARAVEPSLAVRPLDYLYALPGVARATAYLDLAEMLLRRAFQDQQDVLGGFLEVFKYAVKFSDLPLNDNWQGFLELSHKRLVFSFGEFWGVQVPDSLTDEPLDDLPFVDLLFRYFDGGYSWQSDPLQAPLRCAPAMLAGEHGQAEFGC